MLSLVAPPFMSRTVFVPFSQDITAVGDQTISVPAGATWADIECLGSGGTGSADVNNRPGGGGAYSKKLFVALAGVSALWVSVPQGDDTTAGDDAVVRLDNSSGTILCLAKGGGAGSTSGTTQGGQASAGTGDVKFSGGAGANAANYGGGSAAGSAANGNAATNSNGAAAPSPSIGGSGAGASNNAGLGGGGNGATSHGGTRDAGNGRIIIHWHNTGPTPFDLSGSWEASDEGWTNAGGFGGVARTSGNARTGSNKMDIGGNSGFDATLDYVIADPQGQTVQIDIYQRSETGSAANRRIQYAIGAGAFADLPGAVSTSTSTSYALMTGSIASVAGQSLTFRIRSSGAYFDDWRIRSI